MQIILAWSFKIVWRYLKLDFAGNQLPMFLSSKHRASLIVFSCTSNLPSIRQSET